MEMSALIRGYVEIGMLGLCAISMIGAFILTIKNYINKDKNESKQLQIKETNTNRQFEKILELIQEQNKTYQHQIQKQNDDMIKAIISGVTTHVPSKEENNKLTQIQQFLEDELQKALEKTSSARVCLFQYHNGGRGLNLQSFLKMSVTNERFIKGEKPLINIFNNQFRTIFPSLVQTLETTGHCYIENVDTLKATDASAYYFMHERNYTQTYCQAIYNNDGVVVGFLMILYKKGFENTLQPNELQQIIETEAGIIQQLLSWNILNDNPEIKKYIDFD